MLVLLARTGVMEPRVGALMIHQSALIVLIERGAYSVASEGGSFKIKDFIPVKCVLQALCFHTIFLIHWHMCLLPLLVYGEMAREGNHFVMRPIF